VSWLEDAPFNALSYSLLKQMGTSPAHFLHACHNPIRRSSALRRGTIVHRLVLGDGHKAWPLVVWEGRRAGKLWDAFARGAAGAMAADTVVTRSEMSEAGPIAAAVLSSPQSADFLRDASFEVPMEFELDGVPFFTRGIDILQATRIVDLKTCRSTEPGKLLWNARASFWPEQLALYAHASRSNGLPIDNGGGHANLCVEATAPHVVTVLEYPGPVIDAAFTQCREWLAAVRSCVMSGHWPGYAEEPVQMIAPHVAIQGTDALEEYREGEP
jgi:hypothetical protein